MKKVFSKIFMLSVGALAFTACADEYNPGAVTKEDLLKENYAKHWEEVFGTPDPNQDWSMAENVTATVNVSNAEGYEAKFYTKSPLSSGSKFLGQTIVKNGVASLSLDLVKGSESIFVEVSKNNVRPVFGYFELNGKDVIISRTATRAADDSPVTIGDPLNYKIYMLPENVASIDGASKNTQTSGSGFEYEAWNVSNTQQTVQNIYYLNDVDYNTRTDVIHLGDLATFLRSYKNTEDVVKPGVFKEGVEHVSLMGTELQKDAYYVMADDGPITLSYIYKGTVERHNYFGYFYYPKDEEMNAEKFRTINKYILVNYITGAPDQTIHHTGERTKDVTYYVYKDEDDSEVLNKTPYYETDGWNNEWNSDPTSHFVTGIGYPVVTSETFDKEVWWPDHVTYTYFYQTTKTVTEDDPWDEIISGNGSLIQRRYRTQQWNPEKGENEKTGPWTEWANASGMEMSSWIASEYNDDDEIQGTKFKLTFFGYDGTESPTYTFPKDCKVGFFFVKYFDDENNSNNKLYTSFSSLNLDYINQVPTGATFRYRNYVVLGLEDQPEGDCDQNDVLFLAEGNFTDDIPDLTPDDDPEKEPTTQKWLVACEDLGGTFDYDFNDIVLGFEKKDDNHLYLTPLAAGGTLPAVVSFDSDEIGEIHQLLGANPSDGNYDYIIRDIREVATEFDLGECEAEFSITTAIAKLKISVKNGGNAVEIKKWEAEADATPQMILLPGGWDWPGEGVTITDVYPTFTQWAADVTHTDWIKKAENCGAYINNTWGK